MTVEVVGSKVYNFLNNILQEELICNKRKFGHVPADCDDGRRLGKAQKRGRMLHLQQKFDKRTVLRLIARLDKTPQGQIFGPKSKHLKQIKEDFICLKRLTEKEHIEAAQNQENCWFCQKPLL